jgi:hypothetical protein
MTVNKSVKSEGCSSCSCVKECLSDVLLQGSFIRIDGVNFTATMTATGVGETECDAQEQSYKNVIKTLEDFITNYTPKIVEVTYELTYSITCDGKSTCCQPKICNNYDLIFKFYTKNEVAGITLPDVTINGHTYSVTLNDIVFDAAVDTSTTEVISNHIGAVKYNSTAIDARSSSTISFKRKHAIFDKEYGTYLAEIVDTTTQNVVKRGEVDISQTTINTTGTSIIDIDNIKKIKDEGAVWFTHSVKFRSKNTHFTCNTIVYESYTLELNAGIFNSIVLTDNDLAEYTFISSIKNPDVFI